MTATTPTSSRVGTCQPFQLTPASSLARTAAEIAQVIEDEAAQRVDGVGERIDPVQDGQPGRQMTGWEQRARQEVHRHDHEHVQRHERLHLLDARCHHHPEGADGERQQQLDPEHLNQQEGVVGDVHEPGDGDDDQALEAGDHRAAQALAENQRPASHRGHEHLPEESVLPVPHHRCGGHHGRHEDRQAEDPGVEEGAQRQPRPEVDEGAEPAAEHEEEQDRLDQRGDDPDAVVEEAEQLAVEDDLDRPELSASGAVRYPHRGDRTRRVRRRGCSTVVVISASVPYGPSSSACRTRRNWLRRRGSFGPCRP